MKLRFKLVEDTGHWGGSNVFSTKNAIPVFSPSGRNTGRSSRGIQPVAEVKTKRGLEGWCNRNLDDIEWHKNNCPDTYTSVWKYLFNYIKCRVLPSRTYKGDFEHDIWSWLGKTYGIEIS